SDRPAPAWVALVLVLVVLAGLGAGVVVLRPVALFGPRAAGTPTRTVPPVRSEEHTSELQSRGHLVCRLLLEKKKIIQDVRRPSRITMLYSSAFFFSDPPTTETYTLSLHDALPIFGPAGACLGRPRTRPGRTRRARRGRGRTATGCAVRAPGGGYPDPDRPAGKIGRAHV